MDTAEKIELKAEDEGEYLSDNENLKENEKKVEETVDSTQSTSLQLTEKNLKRERKEDEVDKQLKENDEPHTKKKALEHLRNMNFNKKDPFSQLG